MVVSLVELEQTRINWGSRSSFYLGRAVNFKSKWHLLAEGHCSLPVLVRNDITDILCPINL